MLHARKDLEMFNFYIRNVFKVAHLYIHISYKWKIQYANYLERIELAIIPLRWNRNRISWKVSLLHVAFVMM